MYVKDAVVKQFLRICTERGITQNELARCAGVAPSSVYSMLDKQRRNVSIVLIKKLCDGLELSLADFFDSEEFQNLEPEIR